MQPKPNIGIIGAGRLGTALARRFSKSGYSVTIVNSKAPESLSLILKVLLPDVIAKPIPELVNTSDVIVLAIPLHEYVSLDPALFEGKVVIDAMNYWPPTEGVIDAFSGDLSSSEVIQSYFADAHVVKSLNHIAYNELEQHTLPIGSKDRRAIIFAGDDAGAKQTVSDLIDTIGFDPIDAGGLREGMKFQPDTSLFNTRYNAAEAVDLLTKHT